MSHTPEYPEQYVCTECQVVHAGTVVDHRDGDHEYEAPESCGACGATAFVEFEMWPHHHE
ncbi:MAG: hypothetical protein ABEJ68_11385 [Halobacteriaceae archaeon]